MTTRKLPFGATGEQSLFNELRRCCIDTTRKSWQPQLLGAVQKMSETNEDIWAGDWLGREEEAETVTRFLLSQVEARRAAGRTASYVLNVNAEWGHGKSFFLNRLALQLRREGHVVAQVNAWESDFSDQPMVTVMSSVEDALKPLLKTKAKVRAGWKRVMRSSGPVALSLFKGVTTSLVKRHTGDFIEEVADIVGMDAGAPSQEGGEEESAIGEGLSEAISSLSDKAAEALIEAFRAQKESISAFKINLAGLTAQIPANANGDQRIFVLIDELDRCRPTHAISLMESVKHIFNTDGVIFIIGTDTDQLAASIKAVYGHEFDSTRYLLRFFDRTYMLRNADRTAFVRILFESHGIKPKRYKNLFDDVECAVANFEEYQLSLRDIEQCFEIFATITALWQPQVPLQMPYLWPIIIAHHQNNLRRFDALTGRRAIEQDMIPAKEISVYIEERAGRERIHSREITTWELANEYLNYLKKPLNIATGQIFEQTRRGVADTYITEEYQVLHGNSCNPGDPPFSVIQQYRDLVRLAVRFE